MLVVMNLGLAACSAGAAFRAPDTKLPVTWTHAAAEASTDWPGTDWWRGFGSTQLDQFIEQAQRNNDDLAAAAARVREADAQARIAGAPLLPQLGAEAAVTRQRALPAGGTTLHTFNEFEPQLTASYELDFWGANRAAHVAALSNAQASRFDRETVRLTVEGAVAQSYFQAQEMHDRLQVAQNNLANAQHILDGLELELRVGTATALDVEQQAAAVATLNASIPPLTQQLSQSLDALAVLLGSQPETLDATLQSLDSVTPPAVTEGVPSQLLARRPDVAAAEAQLKAANANIIEARAAFFPAVDLTASGGFASAALAGLLTPANRVWAVSASVAETIFDNGAHSGQYQYAKARYSELLSDYHKTVLTALQNVEDALVAVQQTAEQERRQRDAVGRAQRAFDYSQMQMQAGTTNILTVLNTETTLFTSEDVLVQAKFLHLQALISLYQSLGGGWEPQNTI